MGVTFKGKGVTMRYSIYMVFDTCSVLLGRVLYDQQGCEGLKLDQTRDDQLHLSSYNIILNSMQPL